MLWADLVNLKGTKKSARAWAAILNLLNHRRTCGLTESDSGFPLERRGVHRNAARRSISGTVGVGRSLEPTVPISPSDRPGSGCLSVKAGRTPRHVRLSVCTERMDTGGGWRPAGGSRALLRRCRVVTSRSTNGYGLPICA